MSDPRTNAPSPSNFFETLHGFHRTAALKAAIELDLFTAIHDGFVEIEPLAAKCQASPRGIRILCDFLTIIGWLRKEGTSYGLTPDSEAFASKRSPQYIGQSIEFLLSRPQMDAFDHLTSAVRNGGVSSETPEGGSVVPENPLWVDFARAMMPLMAFPSELLAQRLAPGLPANAKVLDIAAGHGLYGLAVARHRHDAEITALDWPNVLAVAQANAEAAGVASRFHPLPGNALSMDLGSNYDLVLVTNFLHHFDKPTCHKLLRKIHASLKPDGTVAILEFIPNEDRVSPSVPASFSLMMLATTPTGDAYIYSEYEELLRNAGYRSSKLDDLTPTYFRVVTAVK
jgi:2-polyprenyl-3-methyl-5-hydroxy-6-metoxy-1,4-benzoquinol methylase